MALAAAQVIDELAGRLVPMAATGGRVYTSRAWPLDTLPAWRVTAEDEAVQVHSLSEPANEHSLSISVAGFAHAVDNLDDTLHALASAALAALFAPPVPHALQLTGINRRIADGAEASVGVITLLLRCTYYVDPAAPEIIL